MKKIISLEIIPHSLTLYPPSFPPTFSLPTFTGSHVTIQAVALNGWIWTFLATISGTEKTYCNIIGLVWYMRYWFSGRTHSEAYGSYAINPSFSMITVTQFCLVKSLFRYLVFVFTRREKTHVFSYLQTAFKLYTLVISINSLIWNVVQFMMSDSQ